MSGLTREDILRELELLPVWKLRQPLPEPVPAPSVEVALQSADVPSVPVMSELPVEPPPAVETSLAVDAHAEIPADVMSAELSKSMHVLPMRAMTSEDGQYLFITQAVEALPDESSELLLQNMLRAMRVTCRTEIQDSVDEIFKQHTPKLVVCLGEHAANQLTQKALTISEWRIHQPHHFQHIPVVVTYAPEYLLQHNQDKRLAWQDLCLAMQLMQSL